MRAGTDCGESLAVPRLRLRLNPGMKTEPLLRLRGEAAIISKAGTGDGARSRDHGIEAGPGALASLWPAILSHREKGCFAMVITQGGSHITSRCSCRKAQQTLAVKFSQSRVA